MKNDLISRYVYAVSLHFPHKDQADITKEVENMIYEMLEARYPGKPANEEEIKALLTELGRPEELAVQYSGEEKPALISGIYYLWFKRLVKLVLPIATSGAAFATLIENFTRPLPQMSPVIPQYFATIVANTIANGLSAGIHSLAILVIILAIMERSKVKIEEVDFISTLPNVPAKPAQIRAHDPILHIFGLLTLAIVMICFPYMAGIYSSSQGWIPVFDTAYVQSLWYLFVIAATAGFGKELYRLFRRYYSKRLALITIITNMINLGIALIFLTDNRVMNPHFIANINSLYNGSANEIVNLLFNHLNIFFLGVVIFALLLDSAVSGYRAWRYDN